VGLDTLEDDARGAATLVRDLASALRSLPSKHPKGLATAWTVLLLVLLLAPRNVLPTVEPSVSPLDLVVHFVLFAGFVLSWLQVGRSRRWWAMNAPIALIMAVSTEYAQGLPWIERDPDLRDGLADSAGVIAGYVVAVINYRWRRSRLSDPSVEPPGGDSAMGSE
jgi:hypothetical protein